MRVRVRGEGEGVLRWLCLPFLRGTLILAGPHGGTRVSLSEDVRSQRVVPALECLGEVGAQPLLAGL